ncbi:unnamed protein product [Amoebophrya sp. A25]|nr:unnamed protein product [Amoebophrya sp. A25]|eukprot:GSA25T00026585001.1
MKRAKELPLLESSDDSDREHEQARARRRIVAELEANSTPEWLKDDDQPLLPAALESGPITKEDVPSKQTNAASPTVDPPPLELEEPAVKSGAQARVVSLDSANASSSNASDSDVLSVVEVVDQRFVKWMAKIRDAAMLLRQHHSEVTTPMKMGYDRSAKAKAAEVALRNETAAAFAIDNKLKSFNNRTSSDETADSILQILPHIGTQMECRAARLILGPKHVVAGSHEATLGAAVADAEFWAESDVKSGAASSSTNVAKISDKLTKPIPSCIEEAVGSAKAVALKKRIDSLKEASIKSTTAAGYASILKTACQLAGNVTMLFPITSSEVYEAFITVVYDSCLEQRKYVVEEKGPHRGKVRWSFMNRVFAAVGYHHEAHCPQIDFAAIARAQTTIRLREALKKACFHGVTEKKNLLNRRGQQAQGQGCTASIKTANELHRFGAVLRTLLALRIGLLAERRKSEMYELEWSCVDAKEDGSLSLNIVKAKADRLARGTTAIVPSPRYLLPSPKAIAGALQQLHHFLVNEKAWSMPRVTTCDDADNIDLVKGKQVDREKDYVFVTYDAPRARLNKISSIGFSSYLMQQIKEAETVLLEKNKSGTPRVVGLRASGMSLHSQFNRGVALKLGGLSNKTTTLEKFYAALQPEQLTLASTSILENMEQVRRLDVIAGGLTESMSEEENLAAFASARPRVRVDVLLKDKDVGKVAHLLGVKTRKWLVKNQWKKWGQQLKQPKCASLVFDSSQLDSVIDDMIPSKR